MAKAAGGRRRRPTDSAEALRQVVTDALVDTDDEQADQWLATSDAEADQVIASCRGVVGVQNFRERLLSGEYGVAGTVHHALQTRGLTT